MKAGREYEAYLFETFKSFYPGFIVNKNDRILGRQSGLKREIDISIRGSEEQTNILYIVQARDRSRPADINTIGEFSAVIRDIGATKGFLICAAGFAKTIHMFARSHGIELLTIEDIQSQK